MLAILSLVRRPAAAERPLRRYVDQITIQDGGWTINTGATTGDFALGFRALERKFSFVSFELSPGELSATSRNLETSSAVGKREAHQVAFWSEATEGLTFYLKPGSANCSVRGQAFCLHMPREREEMGARRRCFKYRHPIVLVAGKGTDPPKGGLFSNNLH